MLKPIVLGIAALAAHASSFAATDVTFWNPTGYQFQAATDWNQWTYVSDGLGGQIGIKYSVAPGFATWNWNSDGVAPHGSIADSIGTNSFAGGDLAALTSSGVNAIRDQFGAANSSNSVNNFTVDLDFSQYKGSAVGGTDGVAGAGTLIGLSDFYAGNGFAKTTVSITDTLSNGTAGSTSGWTLLNGGGVPASAGGNVPGALMSFSNGVLRGTPVSAAGGAPNALDTVMGMLELDGSNIQTVHLNFDLTPTTAGDTTPKVDNMGLYVGSVMPPVAAVPEPETYALMLGGLLAIGGIARRRKPE